MTRARRVTNGLLGAGLCVAAAGCATPVGRYFARRGTDLADCVQAEVGIGWPVSPFLLREPGGHAMEAPARPPSPWARVRQVVGVVMPQVYTRARATDFAVAASGFSQPIRWGWRGRYAEAGTAPLVAAGFPLYRNVEEGAGTAVHTRWLFLTTRTYAGREPGPRARAAESLWLGAAATVVASARLDFNPAELIDFLVGWGGWDLLEDDGRQPKATPGEPARTET